MYPGYNYYPQQMNQYGGNAMMQPQPGLKGRPVSSLEEARVANIDFDGSLFIFPDVANKRIYTKQINLDGTASMKVYSQVEDTPPAPAYVTREEFDSVIKNLELTFSKQEVKKDESNDSKTGSRKSTNPSIPKYWTSSRMSSSFWNPTYSLPTYSGEK